MTSAVCQEVVTCTLCDQAWLYCAVGCSVRVYSVSTLQVETSIQLSCSVWNLAVSQQVLVVNEGERIKIFTKTDWKMVHQVDIGDNISAPCTNIVTTGGNIIFYCRDNSFSVITKDNDIWTTKPLLPPSTFSVDCMDADTVSLAMANSDAIKVVKIEDADSMFSLPESGSEEVLTNLVLANPYVLSGQSSRVQVWHLESRLVIRSLDLEVGRSAYDPFCHDVVSNGRLVAVLSGQGVGLYDLAELGDPEVTSHKLWKRHLEVDLDAVGEGVEYFRGNTEILLNKTCIIARVTTHCDTLRVFNFWPAPS